jgi:hypothetical protein
MSQCLGEDDARTVLIAQGEVGRCLTDHRSHVRHQPARWLRDGSRRERRAEENNRDSCSSEEGRDRKGSVHTAIMRHRRSLRGCHNVDQSKPVPGFVVPMKTIFPGDNPVVLLDRRQPPLNPSGKYQGSFANAPAMRANAGAVTASQADFQIPSNRRTITSSPT